MIKLLIAALFLVNTSIYTIHFNSIDGNDISFSSFTNKKVLIVNIATSSTYVDQLSGLQQLYEQYHDSLVIVVFPSNSFGNEARSNAQIKQFCQDNYHTSFIIAEKNVVAGDSRQAIYNWLASETQNGVSNIFMSGDFQKILIDENGEIMGLFAPEVEPMNSIITNAISSN